jgi:hypothetical protein
MSLVDLIGWSLSVALAWEGSNVAADMIAAFYGWLEDSSNEPPRSGV